MATRLKTVTFLPAILTSVANNTLGNPGAFNIYLPENGKVIKMAKISCFANDIITATGGTITTKTLTFALDAVPKLTVTNNNTLTNSGENLSLLLEFDFTTYFATNWTGTEMVANIEFLANQTTGTTRGFQTVNFKIEITYEYDDTSPTQIKTIKIPMNMPTTGLPTVEGSNIFILPALNSLPEANKVFRYCFMEMNFNEAGGAGTTNAILRTTTTTGASNNTFTKSLATNRFIRYCLRFVTLINTPALHDSDFSIDVWSESNAFNHPQAFVTITYEYSEELSTRIYNSVMLPMEIISPFGGTTQTDYQRATRDLWIQEPGTIEKKEIAFYPFWTQSANITTLNMRVGDGSFISYTDNISVSSGMGCAMVRNDTAFTLQKGKNTFNFDVYTSSTTEHGWGCSGFWLINYISDKAPGGSGSHNHTVVYNICDTGTGAIESLRKTAALPMPIPEDEYFISGFGTEIFFMSSGTLSPAGFSAQVERLVSEGSMQWEVGYKQPLHADNEVGAFLSYSQIRDIFKRFTGDVGVDRIDLEAARRWRLQAPSPRSIAGTGWFSSKSILTYHSLSLTITGEISGLTGTVTVDLWRSTGEKVKTLSRTGDGPYSFTWYDDTATVFVTARDSTKVLKSKTQLPELVFDLGDSGLANGPTYFAY